MGIFKNKRNMNEYIKAGDLYLPLKGVYLRNNSILQSKLNETISLIIDNRNHNTLIKSIKAIDHTNIKRMQAVFDRNYKVFNIGDVNLIIKYFTDVFSMLPYTKYTPGSFILFEGCDAAGKDYIIDKLDFSKYGRFIETREPGGTEISEILRHVILDKEYLHTMSYNTEVLLYATSRAQHVDEILIPAIQAGTNVFCHRYYHTSAIYQKLRGIDVEDIININRFAIRDTNPDLTIIINAKAETINKRLATKNKDRLELEDNDFYKTVLEQYIDIENNEVIKALNPNINTLIINSEDDLNDNVSMLNSAIRECIGGVL